MSTAVPELEPAFIPLPEECEAFTLRGGKMQRCGSTFNVVDGLCADHLEREIVMGRKTQ